MRLSSVVFKILHFFTAWKYQYRSVSGAILANSDLSEISQPGLIHTACLLRNKLENGNRNNRSFALALCNNLLSSWIDDSVGRFKLESLKIPIAWFEVIGRCHLRGCLPDVLPWDDFLVHFFQFICEGYGQYELAAFLFVSKRLYTFRSLSRV